MAVITISRQYGAGGITLGKILAERLGYTFYDGEIIQMLAGKARVSPEFVESIEKEAGGRLLRFVSTLAPQRYVDRILSDERGFMDEEIYVDLLRVIIRKIADKDDSIIIGRGSQYILEGQKGVYHFLLVSDKKNRVKFIEDTYGLSNKQAEKLVKIEDKRRISLYKKFNKLDYNNPGHYHLVLNMDFLKLTEAADIVCTLVKR
jgi:cytidylate kinase